MQAVEPPPVVPDGMDAVEPGVEDIAPPPETRNDPKAANAWAKARQNEKRLAAELKAATARLAQMQTSAQALETELSAAKEVNPEIVAELQRKLEDAEDRIGQLDLAQSRSFRSSYDDKLNDLYMRGVAMLQRVGGKTAEDAQALMTKLVQSEGNGEKIQDLLMEESPALQGTLLQSTMDIMDLATRRAQRIKEWRDTKAQLATEEIKTRTAETIQDTIKRTDKAVQDLVTENSWLFVTSPSDEDWNAQREDLVRAGRAVLREGNGDKIAKLVLEGLAASQYRTWGEAEHARAEQLQGEMDARLKARPGLGGATPSDAPASAVVKKAINPDEWLSKELGM